MEEGDRDNNNGLIRWAKRKITGSIMWRMVPTTTTTMTMTGNNNSNSNSNPNSNKRQKKIGRFYFDDDLNRNANNNNNNNCNKDNKLVLVTLLFSSGLPLTKLMSYLEPCDILNCLQTCKKWNIDMNKDEIWYEVLVSKHKQSSSSSSSSFFSPSSRNNNGALLLDAIMNSNNNNNDNDTQEEEKEIENDSNDDATTTTATATAAARSKSNSNSKLNYRNIAIAMSRKMNDYEEEEVIPKIFPNSKLKLKDVLVVIEIRDKLVNLDDNNDNNNNNNTNINNNDKYKQLGSFCSDLAELTEDKPGHSKYISYDSNSSNNRSSRNNCFSNILCQTKLDDDDDGCGMACIDFEMSSRLIRHDTGKCIVLNDYESIRYYKGDKEGCFMTDNELKPNGRTLSGTIARDVCSHYNYNHIGFDLDFIMERVSDFEYKIKSFQFKLIVSKGGGSGSGDNDGDDDNDDDDDDNDNENEEEFNSMNHFLLFLEGLDWK